ncbi:MAG: hypothetical protein KKB59_14125 [Spirochaetes bacterium]|nr:hypothetical protein [Spirochaetota bacterium]
MNLTLLQNNFISGEVSPLLEGRIDSPRYQTGLRMCQNFLPIRQGGLRKRSGTNYAGTTRSNSKARLIEVTATSGDYYIIELTDQKARIWKQDFSIDGGGSPTELVTPWNTSALFALKCRVMKGILWIVHPSFAPRTISLSGGVWSIATPTFTGDRTFAATDKYPRAVFFHAGRAGFAGTNAEPVSEFLSRSPVAATGADRFTDMTMGTAADNAIYLQEADMNGTSIRWAIGQRRLLIGTDRAIWMDNGQMPTPATFDMNIVSYTGSADVQPALLENTVLYIGRGGTSLHALIYSEEGGGFVDYDLSKDAEHFLASPVVELKVMSYPDPIVWLVRTDGLLVSCTIDFKNGVVAWARHPMAEEAIVESVAVGSTSNEDVVWLSILRGSTRTVEYMRFANLNTALQADFHFVDCGLSFTYGSPTATVTGLSHLEGKTVTAWADGAVLPPKTVVSGSVTYDRAVTKIHIGLTLTSKAHTLRPEVPANGTSQGKQKNIEKAILRLFRSLGGSIGASNSSQFKLLTWRSGSTVWGASPDLFTGDLTADIVGSLDPDTTLELEHTEPAPFTLLAIIYRVAIKEV